MALLSSPTDARRPGISRLFDFGEFPALSGSRVTLCELDREDARDVFGFRGDPEVQRYNGVPDSTLQDTRRFIEGRRELYRNEREVTWGIRSKETGCVIGGISLFDRDRYHRHAQIGYDLARAHWGEGLASESIRLVLGFGFERMLLKRVEIWTSTANARSLKLAERLGFQREGTLRRRILEDDGQFYDCAVFGLLRGEWAASEGVAQSVHR